MSLSVFDTCMVFLSIVFCFVLLSVVGLLFLVYRRRRLLTFFLCLWHYCIGMKHLMDVPWGILHKIVFRLWPLLLFLDNGGKLPFSTYILRTKRDIWKYIKSKLSEDSLLELWPLKGKIWRFCAVFRQYLENNYR